MRDFGWLEGRDFVTIPTSAKFGCRMEVGDAKGIVAENPDLIITKGTARALAAHQATSAIPIVMFSSGYPVEAGLANSLARPGKNVTGNTIYAGGGVWSKLLELLREARPGIKRVAVYWRYVPPAFPREEIEPCHQELRQAAQKLGLMVHIVEVPSVDRDRVAISAIDAERPDALLLTSQDGMSAMQYAAIKRLPTIAESRWPPEIEPYPLLVYGAMRSSLAQQAAFYVVRILRDGIKPADLPIQLPARFELLVNLKTAKAVGLELPQSLLIRADEVLR
jgi:putative tryptophan/tyrosine transport system substrate-binding protein